MDHLDPDLILDSQGSVKFVIESRALKTGLRDKIREFYRRGVMGLDEEGEEGVFLHMSLKNFCVSAGMNLRGEEGIHSRPLFKVDLVVGCDFGRNDFLK